MGFEKARPWKVEKAIEDGDRKKIVELGRAGGNETASRKAFREQLDREMHERSMQQMAKERHDDLLPDDE